MFVKSIPEIIDEVISVEGNYVNNPNDKGGPTKYGVTQVVARQYGYTGDMRDFPRSLAVQIYIDQYVNKPNFNLIHQISPAIAYELIDTGINSGTGTPSKWLQRWLNAFNAQATLYKDIKVDGGIGTGTVGTFNKYLRTHDALAEKAMLYALNCSQGNFYLNITEKREQNESFTFGWLSNRVTDINVNTTYKINPAFDNVATVSNELASVMSSFLENVSANLVSVWLQEWLNSFNNQGTLYKDIKVDGSIGNGTLSTLNLYLSKRGKTSLNVLIKGLECSYGAFMLEMNETDTKNEEKLYSLITSKLVN